MLAARAVGVLQLRRGCLAAVVTSLALLSGSCASYRFVHHGGELPAGVQRVCVPLLHNDTSEPGLEAVMTQALRAEADRAGVLATDGCDAELTGHVVAVTGAPLMTAPGKLPTYRLTATLSLELKKGSTPVSTGGASRSEDYPSGPDVLLTEANRQAALQRLAERLAQDAWEALASR